MYSEKLMLAKFNVHKERFKGKPRHGEDPVIRSIDLPDGIGETDRPSDGIIDGNMIISDEEMEEMFQESVNGTLRLVDEQVVLIRSQNLQVKCIFLSGGFSRNDYFYRKVSDLARSYRFRVERGDDSWTAVAKGAVLMGLGIGCQKPPANSSAPYHIGVVLAERFASYLHEEQQRYADSFDGVYRAKDHINWVIAKGDLVTPDEMIEKKLKIFHKINPQGKKAGRIIVVISDHEERMNQLSRIQQRPGVTIVNLDYDLDMIPESLRRDCYERTVGPKKSQTYDRVEMQLVITVLTTGDTSLDLRAGVVEVSYAENYPSVYVPV
ncbi:hypothetical protein ONZ43_g2029 [Nemania bipapillata]|uniref:Uncharacterized protein n=1 Tax=Nemania bipapillata TaxID=110536 RepID=A0ACC2J2W7_9PEZI|nr:hypothetical protein ONZ43_g2029 [Nemania bipapillata]